MTSLDLARQRLSSQHLTTPTFERPGALVQWMGAVQAQDYLGALWAVGLRVAHATEGAIEQALADRTIIRTWPMRGTLHFVAAADVRWMLELLTPRIVAGSAWRLKQLDLDDAVIARSKELFINALHGGKQLTRDALYNALEAGGVATGGGRGLHLLGQLAQSGIICFGAREGKQHTFALLDEWAPGARSMERDAALAELARRYVTSHGPATLQDFAWWSGLAIADARVGIEMAKPHLAQEILDGKTYWLPMSLPTPIDAPSRAYLLPPYDEYTVAYKDRDAVLDPAYAKQAGNGIFSPVIVVDGRVVGTWKRSFKQNTVVLTAQPFTELGETERRALEVAAQRYSDFLGMSVSWS
jgi:hypothetical protein